MPSLYSRLTGWQSPEFFIIISPGTACADLNIHLTKIMATKKTTQKTTKPAAEKTAATEAPAAKKTAKKVAKTTATADEKSEKKPTTAKPAAKKTAVNKTAEPKTTAKITPDVLARAAYLNYRRRVEQGLPGDSHGDWLEAERTMGKTSDS